uniref:FRIGIDA-like protein n=1 Tax=Elaeis guineensis var. tenera TaxID=51953 RepID=A0A8N4IAZ6_ELAGV|nr:uncharacterized protein LOC105034377 isoform X3 [Elaeis guineensis]
MDARHRSGEIHVILGPMFAGKTTTLLRRIQSESSNGRRVAMVKSNKDTRYAVDSIVTHDGAKMRCWAVPELSMFQPKLGVEAYDKLDVIGIDEAQFFEDLYDFCCHAADRDGKIVVVAGLDGDYLRLTARCELCGQRAFFTLRKTEEKQTELIGGADVYMPVCREHYVHGQTNWSCNNCLVLSEDLIQKLNSRGKQLDSVKFVYAFNLEEQCPPVPLLKAYVMESKKAAKEVRKKGNNSSQSQNEAISKELGALKSVLRAVEEYKLEAAYPRENLEKQIARLEKLKADRKRTAAAASNSKTQQQPNKRPWQSSSSKPAVAVHTVLPVIQNQPQLGLADRAPYVGLGGSYSLAATGSLYNHAGQNVSGTPIGLGGLRSPPRSYLYPSNSLVGTGGLYDRPVNHAGYPASGMPPSYGSSLYPP